MSKTKLLVLGSMMASIAIIFQVLPVYFTEAFAVLTAFSALPVFIITKYDPKIGILTVLVSLLSIGMISMHEALFFLFANAPVGFTLGFCSHIASKRHISICISSIVLTCMLCILNFIFGFPIFGVPLSSKAIVQVAAIIIFSFAYCFVSLYFCEIVYRKLAKINVLKN